MNKHCIIHIACLALVASPFTISHAQLKKPETRAVLKIPGPPPPLAGEAVEVQFDESSDGPIGIARAAVGDAERTVRKIFAGPGETLDRPLVISSSSLDEQAVANLEEDISIMARILEKSTDRGGDDDRDRKAMGIHLWALGQGGSRGARNLYIDGHGAVFMLNANMPLLATSTKPAPEEKKETASSSWEKARNELYGRDEESDRRRPREHTDARPYNAERVNALKDGLIESLKNATHIRGLKENEHVTIVVQGPSEPNIQRLRNESGRGDVRVEAFAFAGQGSGGPRSVLTLRAKKSDIDAFAKGKLDEDEFRKKVAIATYRSSSGGGGGRNYLIKQ